MMSRRPATAASGKAAAHDLAEGGQVRHHPVVLLGAAVGEAEAGDDLVEDQRDAVARGDRAHALEKARLRHDQPLERLHDHRGEIVVVRLDHRLGLGQVVERGDQHLALDRVRDAGRVRGGGRERLRLARAHAHQGVVVHAVEAALELQDLVPAADRRARPAARRRSPRCRCRRSGPAPRRAPRGRSPRRGPGSARSAGSRSCPCGAAPRPRPPPRGGRGPAPAGRCPGCSRCTRGPRSRGGAEPWASRTTKASSCGA